MAAVEFEQPAMVPEVFAALRDRTRRILGSTATPASSGATSASGVAPDPSTAPTSTSVVAMDRTRSVARQRSASLPCDGRTPEICREGRAAA